MPYTPPILLRESDWGKEEYKDLCTFIKDKVKHLDMRLQAFRTEKLPEYVRLYKGRPKNKEVDWPWPGAANLVIQLIGTFSDELLSRVIGSIWLYDPLWTAVLGGDIPNKEGNSQKQILEQFLMDMAYTPEELDLYRVEQAADHSAIKYGTGWVYTPYEYTKEIEYTYIGGGESSSSLPHGEPREVTRRDGPHPELLPLNRALFDPSSSNLQDMKFYGFIQPLDYWDVKNLPSKSPYYKDADIEQMLNSPDAIQETEMEREINEQFSFGSGIDTGAARWYIYNLFFKYQKGEQTFSFGAKYWKHEEKILYITYNNYPDNIDPIEDVKLSYDDETYLGEGYAEMLHAYQKELSNNSNWRTNNRNYNMMGVWRVSPESKLSSILEFYPGVAVPAKEGEIELLKPGADTGYNDGPDQFISALAKERAGIDPAIGGTGGGIVNPKRGIYSAAGTSMVMAQQNNRNNIRTADMRTFHVRLGIKFLKMYSHWGIGGRLRRYGDNAEALRKALDNFKNGSLGLYMRPTSAMYNKELERQNDILLTDKMGAWVQAQAQIIEAVMNPQIPPPLKMYYAQALIANRLLMQDLLRNFNKTNVETLLPQIKDIVAMSMQPPQGAGNANQSNGRPNPTQGVPQGAVQFGGVPGTPQLPQ
ncbi:MAG TPA: hypothetical protein VII99_10565 [Bacteroidia bacterium]